MRRGAAPAFAAWLCLLPSGSAPDSSPPEVSIAYSRPLDSACSLIGGSRLDPEAQAELEARLPELRRAWAREGQPVLDRIFALTGKRLGNGRHQVRLTLCGIPSSSPFGAIVNMRHALPGFTDRPVPLGYKIAVIDHELLHRLLAGVDLSGSGLLEAHSAESRRVRDHLHLFALLKAAFLDLGRASAFEELVRTDSRLPEPAYRRAWEIVNAGPGAYLAYVEEVRSAR